MTAFSAIVDAPGDISNDLKSWLVVVTVVIVTLHGVVVSPAEVGGSEGDMLVRDLQALHRGALVIGVTLVVLEGTQS